MTSKQSFDFTSYLFHIVYVKTAKYRLIIIEFIKATCNVMKSIIINGMQDR